MTKIDSCSVHLLVQELDEKRGPSSAWYGSRESVLVRLTDSDGRTGWGETCLAPGVVDACRALAEAAVGADPLEARALVDRLARMSDVAWALSAVSIALDDLRGRVLGVPVATLYGGRTRERVRPYASSGGYHMTRPPEELWRDEIVQATEAGFDAFKIRIGRYAPERELEVIRSIRAQLGSAVDLAADGNGAYPLQEAVRVGRELDELGFLWLEEPTNRGRGNVKHPGYPGVAAVLDIPIAGGEGLTNRSDYKVLMESGAVDVVQPDVTICGGIGEALFVAELAALNGRWCIPHAWGGAVVLAATLQLLATVPHASEIEDREGPLLEYDIFENLMRTELATEPIEVRDGSVAIPDRPGLGIEIDEGFVARFDVLGRT